MKRCPTCDKTFPDGMKFCQTDGTVLVEDAADPYKTVVGNQSDMPAPPLDPFKTMVASPPPPKFSSDDDDLLQLPEQEPDAMKTMLVSQDEINQELNAGKVESAPPALDLPPAAPSAPLIEPEVPRSVGGDVSAKNSSNTAEENAPPSSPFDSKPFQNDFSGQSPYGNTDNLPIPSPFQDSLPPGGFQPPIGSPFNEPKAPIKEPEPQFRDAPDSSSVQSPFGGQSPSAPFGNAADQFNQPLVQAEWTPPPAPVAGWQDQGLGANTPFQPPVTGGQDQTLAIVSLVCGVLSIICCGAIAGIPAIITGYMAKNNVDSNPSQYTGRGMAIAGMILGGVSLLFTALYLIYMVVVGFSMR